MTSFTENMTRLGEEIRRSCETRAAALLRLRQEVGEARKRSHRLVEETRRAQRDQQDRMRKDLDRWTRERKGRLGAFLTEARKRRQGLSSDMRDGHQAFRAALGAGAKPSAATEPSKTRSKREAR